jgi:hypothetical protein
MAPGASALLPIAIRALALGDLPLLQLTVDSALKSRLPSAASAPKPVRGAAANGLQSVFCRDTSQICG